MTTMNPARIPMKLVPPPLVPAAMWFNASMALTEMLVASAQVISHRTGMMLGARGPMTPEDCAEFTLMFTEKMTAWPEVSTRAMIGWMDLNRQFTRSWFSASSNPRSVRRNLARANLLSKAAAKVAADVVDPLHGKATANARRLAALRVRSTRARPSPNR